jgi:sialate O-acetylesterase
MKRLTMMLSVLLAAAVCCGADLKVHPIFGKNMLMQRNAVIPLSGKAKPGADVTIKFKGKTSVVKADKDGKWRLDIPPMEADTQEATMIITSGKERKVFTGILVGDVILLSGQSHMATSYGYKLSELKNDDPKRKLPAETCKALTDEINNTLAAEKDDVLLRSCSVWSDGTTSWWTGKRENVRRFSVAGHNIAKVLRRELNVPVALISMSRGSSSIESWIPPEYFDHPVLVSEKPNIAKYLAFRDAHKAKTLTHAELEAYMVDLYNQPRWRRYRSAHVKNGKVSPKVSLFHQGSVQPTACFENQTKAVNPFPVKAMIWWQGETNYREPFGDYTKKLRILFSAYRKLWNRPDLPIAVILQGQRINYKGLYNLARLEQYEAVNGLPNTYMVNNLMTPIAEVGMVHPYHEKIQAGKDAGALLLKHVYGKDSIASGPFFDSAKIADGKAVVSLRFAKGLKTTDGKAPVGFELAGKDGKYYEASAVIDGEKVIVSSDKVAEPCYVRYMWEDVKNVCNLVNEENLTAFPFDTQLKFFQKPNVINGK